MPALEAECGVARRIDCDPELAGGGGWGGRRTRAAALDPVDDPFALPPPYAPKPLRTNRQTLMLTADLPFVVFVVLLTLFTVAYHFAPALVWIGVMLAADAVLVGAWPPKGGNGYRPRDRSHWLPLLVGIFSLGAAIFLGTINASVLEPWIHINYLKRHTDVLPSEKPQVYSDAGVLLFAPGSSVDLGAAAGYSSWPQTYCAAPIRGPDSTGGAETGASPAEPSPLGFFAVGKNCCGARGGFTCGDAERGGRSAIRLEASELASAVDADGQNLYMRAAMMSAAANGEVVAPSPVLVVWSKEPESVAITAWRLVVAMYSVALIGALVLFCLTRRFFTRGRPPPRLPSGMPPGMPSGMPGGPWRQ